MLKSYKTVQSKASCSLTIKKSKFISHIAPVEHEAKAQEFIDKKKEKYSDAAHNVFAYRIGLGADIKRQSDDGEPAGTAGKPVLEAIENQAMRNVVIVVTRYFGGIKLGAGGLIRAYSKSARAGISEAGIVTRSLYKLIEIQINYTYLGKIQNEIDETKSWMIRGREYGEMVCLKIAVPEEDIDSISQYLNELTAGQVKIKTLDSLYL